MPFGITSASAVFQRTMDNLLQGLKNVMIYIDDILITGETHVEHLSTLDEVPTLLETAGVCLKQNKMAPEVVYLGYQLSKKGLQPTDDKVQAITNMPRPTNMSELRASPQSIKASGPARLNHTLTTEPCASTFQRYALYYIGCALSELLR